MKSKFKIVLESSTTYERIMKEENFITFEEACIFAKRLRNAKGHEWATVSIAKLTKGNKSVVKT